MEKGDGLKKNLFEKDIDFFKKLSELVKCHWHKIKKIPFGRLEGKGRFLALMLPKQRCNSTTERYRH